MNPSINFIRKVCKMMKIFKKVFALISCMAMVVSISSCGSTGDNSSTDKSSVKGDVPQSNSDHNKDQKYKYFEKLFQF